MNAISVLKRRPLKFHPDDLERLRAVCETPGQLCQARSIYMALCEFRSYAGSSRNSTFVGVSKLSEVSGVSRAGVFRALKLLLAAGVISRERLDHTRTRTVFHAEFYDAESSEVKLAADIRYARTRQSEILTLENSDQEIYRRNKRAQEPAAVRDTRRLKKHLEREGFVADTVEVKAYRGAGGRSVVVTALGALPQAERAAIRHYFAAIGKQAIIENAVQLSQESKSKLSQITFAGAMRDTLHSLGAELRYITGGRVYVMAPAHAVEAAAAAVRQAGFEPVVYNDNKTKLEKIAHAN